MIIWIAIAVASLISHLLLPTYITYLLIAGLIYKILQDIHLIGQVKYSLGTIRETVIYYKSYKGDYKNSGNHFRTVKSFINKHKLDTEYSVTAFGFYFDNPEKVKVEDLRAIIGVSFINDFTHKELVDDLVSQGYSLGKIPATSSVVSRLDIVHCSLIPLAIMKFYKDWANKTKDKEFLKRFRITSIENSAGIIEKCRSKSIEFDFPIATPEKFQFFEADKAVPN